MKKSELTFTEGFTCGKAQEAKKRGDIQMAFDWDKAAEIIKERLKTNPSLVAEAGLQGDWSHTGGIIFEEGKPTNENYTYLSSNWAKPTLEIDGEDIECWTEENERFDYDTKWDDVSLGILGIALNEE